MTGRLATLFFLTSTSLIQTAEIPQQIPLTVVEVGGNATFHCPVSEKDGKFFHWYKQPLGYMVQTVASGSFQEQKLRGQFNNGRFKITERTAEYILTIRNVTKEDEGTYFCQNGTAYSQSFAAGIYLVVNDHIGQSFISVSQTPTTISVQEGDTVTLSCSLLSKTKENTDGCSGENSVYWFRVGLGESHPNIVYDKKNCSDAQERQSCGYRLSKTMKTPSDAGTYYCAVVTCGRILLGQGTKVDIGQHVLITVIILGVLLACCVTIIVILIVYIKQRVCKGVNRDISHPGRDRSMRNKSNKKDADADAVNYVALNFSTRKAKGIKKRKESPQECVYSAVRTDHQTLQETS
ncbi:uncharacterized protein LOC108236633 [Kryptolebias marmoratus]|uniref:uncharacterized protein LOC108236633 n=1 Tax=Kryptolebias marmoratus TaxID=37003 RepID=UPI0007F86FF9|nr:uncharacterized protein LOC108236633 [Kryptolebias marmoratus]